MRFTWHSQLKLRPSDVVDFEDAIDAAERVAFILEGTVIKNA